MKGVVSRKPRVLARCPVRKAANKASAERNAIIEKLHPLLVTPLLPSDTPPSKSARRLAAATSVATREFLQAIVDGVP